MASSDHTLALGKEGTEAEENDYREMEEADHELHGEREGEEEEGTAYEVPDQSQNNGDESSGRPLEIVYSKLKHN